MKIGVFKIGEQNILTCGSFQTDLLGNNPPVLIADNLPNTYDDISSIENWHIYGKQYVGQFTGFRDWKAIRREIIAVCLTKMSNDWNNFGTALTQVEKEIASEYVINKITGAQLAAVWGVDYNKFLELSRIFDENSIESRKARYQAGRLYIFNMLQIQDAMKVVDDMSNGSIHEAYINGIESLATDGYAGIIDYCAMTAGSIFETTGLQSKFTTTKLPVENNMFVSNSLVSILRDGIY